MEEIKRKLKALGNDIYEVNEIYFIAVGKAQMAIYNKDGIVYNIASKLWICGDNFKQARIYVSKVHKLYHIDIVYDKTYRVFIDSNNNILNVDFMYEDNKIWLCVDNYTLMFYDKQKNIKNQIKYSRLNIGTRLRSSQYGTFKLVEDRYILADTYWIDLLGDENGTLFIGKYRIFEKFIGFGTNSKKKQGFINRVYVFGKGICELNFIERDYEHDTVRIHGFFSNGEEFTVVSNNKANNKGYIRTLKIFN